VDLLSGETVHAAKAIISNLTVWDTYGKLFGLNRTPGEIRKQLNALRGSGAYLLYAAVDETTAARLAAEHIFALTESQPNDSSQAQLNVSMAPAWNPCAPEGKRAVTIHTPTNVDDWFTYHQDESEHEAKDQTMMEEIWLRLHSAFPEFGSGIEIIDSATPRTFYDTTRRKLGMVGSIAELYAPGSAASAFPALSHQTPLPNVYRVGDTTLPGPGIHAVTQSALIVVNELTS
jgi:phytoene dehydrogenase-like protein